ncbi:helix-turn-helix domain-containing protein [Candidatus Saccharibacteria bacterium]|nr:helix-turn-helix domain-containing protein [Candidatus Saccharibacteria bacterium]
MNELSYAEKLQKILVVAGWTQDYLADLMKVSTPTMNSWVNGRSEPRNAGAEMIDEAYDEIVRPTVCEAEERVDSFAKMMLKRHIRQLPDDNVCKS